MIRKAHVTFDSLDFGEGRGCSFGDINGEDAISSVAARDEDGDIDEELADSIWDTFYDAFQSFDEEYHSHKACVYCESCLIQDEPGARVCFSYKMSLEERIAHAGY